PLEPPPRCIGNLARRTRIGAVDEPTSDRWACQRGGGARPLGGEDGRECAQSVHILDRPGYDRETVFAQGAWHMEVFGLPGRRDFLYAVDERRHHLEVLAQAVSPLNW